MGQPRPRSTAALLSVVAVFALLPAGAIAAAHDRQQAFGISAHGEAVHLAGHSAARARRVRREAHLAASDPSLANGTNLPPKLSADEAADRLIRDGVVDTYNAIDKDLTSKIIQQEEESLECQMDTPIWQCMEKYGSYGVRRLFSDDIGGFEELGVWQKDWMSHWIVQRTKIFDLSLPGTHESGAYGFDANIPAEEMGNASVKGVLTQHWDVFTQLSAGVRSLSMQVAVAKTTGELYAANGYLLQPLARVLTDVASFLANHHHEIVFIFLKKATVWQGITDEHIQPLKSEENDVNKIPGESVHKGVAAVLGDHLSLFDKLSTLNKRLERKENPTVGGALDAGIRVFYYWEGQQVLCLNKKTCLNTPGWQRGDLGSPLPFGPGMPVGVRANAALQGGGDPTGFVEPGCKHSSAPDSSSANPIQLLLNIKSYARSLQNNEKRRPPTCFDKQFDAPDVHLPPLMYEADVWPSPFSSAEGAQRDTFETVSEIYTRGEAATSKSEAERVNYLLLTWMMRKNWRPLFRRVSIYSMDHVAPVIISRLIEANQERKDCGFAVYCKPTGSCWAKSMLDLSEFNKDDDRRGGDGKAEAEGDLCLHEEDVQDWLKWWSDGRPWPTWLIVICLILCGCIVKLCMTFCCCRAMGNQPFPRFKYEDATGIIWVRKYKKPDPAAEEAPAAEGEGEGEWAGEDTAAGAPGAQGFNPPAAEAAQFTP